MIKNLLIQISVLMFIFSLSFVGTTYGRVDSVGFNDLEESLENNLNTTTLDFSLTSSSFNITSFKPGDNASASAQIKKDGVLDFKYNISAVKTGGDDNLCNALQIEAKLDGVSKYSGNLTGLSLTPEVTISDGQDDWTFILSLVNSDAALQDKSCNFNIIYKGWQTDSNGSWGFSDEELVGNDVASGNWGAASLGDIVINELMWMGSHGGPGGNDEWIELRNMTDRQIDLSGWQITKLVGSETLMLTILSGQIEANGYFLISYFDKANSSINVDPDLVSRDVSLRNENLQIKLYKDDWTSAGNLIDTADDGNGAPLAGVNGVNRQSMERNSDPATGWHTCINAACNDLTYWDAEGNNYGTPKAANLSENDPSSPEYIPVPEQAPPQGSPGPEVIEINIPPEASPAANISPELVSLPIPDPVVENEPSVVSEVTPTPILPEPIVTSVPEQQSTPVTEDKKNE